MKTELTFIMLSREEDTDQWCHWLGESDQLVGKGVGGFRLLVKETPYPEIPPKCLLAADGHITQPLGNNKMGTPQEGI